MRQVFSLLLLLSAGPSAATAHASAELEIEDKASLQGEAARQETIAALALLVHQPARARALLGPGWQLVGPRTRTKNHVYHDDPDLDLPLLSAHLAAGRPCDWARRPRGLPRVHRAARERSPPPCRAPRCSPPQASRPWTSWRLWARAARRRV